MRERLFTRTLLAGSGALLLCLLSISLAAQEEPGADAMVNSATAQVAPVPLPAGPAEVLKLARAKVSDDTINAFVTSSGKSYPLTADQIVYLRNQGVSDGVLTAMLNQQSKLNQAATTAAPQPQPAPPPVATYPPTGSVAYAPVSSAPSTVYYIPYSPTSYYSEPYYYSSYWPYYYYSPGISFSFGYGGCYYGSRYCGWSYPSRSCYGGYSHYYPGSYWGTAGYRGGTHWSGGYRGAPGYAGRSFSAPSARPASRPGGFSGGGVRVSSTGGGFHGGGSPRGHR